MLTVLFFVLGTIGAFVVLLAVVITVTIIATLPYRLGRKKDIVWEVDLREKLPPVTRQKGNSCACHAAAAVLGYNGITIQDPDEWYKDVNFWGVWGRDDGLDNITIYCMLDKKLPNHDDYRVLSMEQILPAIKAGKPVFVGIKAAMHIVDAVRGNIPFARQDLVRGYHFLKSINKYAKKPLLSGHAMVICGVSTDGKTLMMRDSAGVNVGEGGYWAMPVSMLLDSVMDKYAIVIK